MSERRTDCADNSGLTDEMRWFVDVKATQMLQMRCCDIQNFLLLSETQKVLA